MPLGKNFNTSNIYSPLQADYTERKFVYTYYGSSDVMKGIGGFNEMFGSIMAQTGPFLIMGFVYTLSKYLLTNYQTTYHKQTVGFL